MSFTAFDIQARFKKPYVRTLTVVCQRIRKIFEFFLRHVSGGIDQSSKIAHAEAAAHLE